MAEVTNHILFARKIMKRLNINNKNFYIYSVGPDSFYFNRNTFNYAKDMHRTNSRLFFLNFIDYIKCNNLVNNENVTSCLYGFLTHYVLDFKIHPYVFYKGGIYYKDDIKTLKYLDGHRRIEMGISRYYYGKNINKLKMYKYMCIFRDDNIINSLNYTLKKTFNIDDGFMKYFKSYKNMSKVYKYFRYDKYGIKKIIYSFIDLFRKNKSKLSIVSFYNISKVDLNSNHSKWFNPCDKNICYNQSVDDLFNECENDTIALINLINDYLNDIIDKNEFMRRFPNNSYLSGIDCDNKKRMIYFE